MPGHGAPGSAGPALIERPEELTVGVTGPVELAPALLARLRQRRAAMLTALTDGAGVYGVNTGMGAMSKRRLDEAEQRVHQRNLLLGRAVGGPPWLPYAEARAVVLTRLRTFLTGDAAVSAELCQRLTELLNSGFVPAVPARGAGSAGEIIPLAHAFGPLVGIGSLLDTEGNLYPAAVLPASFFALGTKEGISLLAGLPGATGRVWYQAAAVERLADRVTEAGAAAIAVIGANRDPYDARTGRADPALAAEHARLMRLAGPEREPAALQAPVSFRVAGYVAAHLRRSLTALTGAVDRALDGVTDSPAFLDGGFVGTAGFHGLDLAAHCDQVVAALTQAAEVSTARMHRLLNPLVTGLPAQLARDPGPQAGLVAVHKRAVGTVHQLRRLASPTTVGTMETSNGQEDVQSFAWEAAGGLAEAVRLTREVVACEWLTVFQAFALSGRPVPPGLREPLAAVAAVVPPIEADRPFGADLERILAAVV